MAPTLIAGVDEVGIGSLAGPVVAAAVILNPKIVIEGIMDSKKIPEKKRERISSHIRSRAIAWAIGEASLMEIDELNILKASHLAMERAVNRLAQKPLSILVDGNKSPNFSVESTAIVKGDVWVPAISAASIVAKVYRDNLMRTLDLAYPFYGFAKHKGYPTKKHIEMLRALGPCQIHRRGFSPVRNWNIRND